MRSANERSKLGARSWVCHQRYSRTTERSRIPVMATEPKTPWVHKWEQAGYGKAPFRVVGFSVEKYRAHPDAPLQPGSSCDICGQGIMNVCRIRSADNHEFKVGIDCVAHTGDTALLAEAKSAKRTYRSPEEKARLREVHAIEAKKKQAELDERALEHAKKYEQEIRNATLVVGAEHVPDELRNTAKEVLEGLVTGKWKSGPTKDQIAELEIAAEIAKLPPWKNTDAWMGKPGDKITNLRVLYLGGPSFKTQFGWNTINKFRVIEGPDAGKLLVWFTSSRFGESWSVTSINATVKKHDSYGDEIQTQLTRVTEYEDPVQAAVFKPGMRVNYQQQGGNWKIPAIVEAVTPKGKVRIKVRYSNTRPVDRVMASTWHLSEPGPDDDLSKWDDLDKPDFSPGDKVWFRTSQAAFGQKRAVVVEVTKAGRLKVRYRDGSEIKQSTVSSDPYKVHMPAPYEDKTGWEGL